MANRRRGAASAGVADASYPRTAAFEWKEREMRRVMKGRTSCTPMPRAFLSLLPALPHLQVQRVLARPGRIVVQVQDAGAGGANVRELGGRGRVGHCEFVKRFFGRLSIFEGVQQEGGGHQGGALQATQEGGRSGRRCRVAPGDGRGGRRRGGVTLDEEPGSRRRRAGAGGRAGEAGGAAVVEDTGPVGTGGGRRRCCSPFLHGREREREGESGHKATATAGGKAESEGRARSRARECAPLQSLLRAASPIRSAERWGPTTAPARPRPAQSDHAGLDGYPLFSPVWCAPCELYTRTGALGAPAPPSHAAEKHSRVAALSLSAPHARACGPGRRQPVGQGARLEEDSLRDGLHQLPRRRRGVRWRRRRTGSPPAPAPARHPPTLAASPLAGRRRHHRRVRPNPGRRPPLGNGLEVRLRNVGRGRQGQGRRRCRHRHVPRPRRGRGRGGRAQGRRGGQRRPGGRGRGPRRHPHRHGRGRPGARPAGPVRAGGAAGRGRGAEPRRVGQRGPRAGHAPHAGRHRPAGFQAGPRFRAPHVRHHRVGGDPPRLPERVAQGPGPARRRRRRRRRVCPPAPGRHVCLALHCHPRQRHARPGRRARGLHRRPGLGARVHQL